MRPVFSNNFSRTPLALDVLANLGGEAELRALRIAGVENLGEGILFRIYGRDDLDLQAVIDIRREGVFFLVSVQTVGPQPTFSEFTVEPLRLKVFLQSLPFPTITD